MENNTMTTMTNSTSSNPCPTSAFGMPASGRQLLGGVERIPATGLTTTGSVIRDRKDLAAKGHVAFVAYVPGIPAWSPPIC